MNTYTVLAPQSLQSRKRSEKMKMDTVKNIHSLYIYYIKILHKKTIKVEKSSTPKSGKARIKAIFNCMTTNILLEVFG